MSAAKHTPGPWHIDGAKLRIYDKSETVVAEAWRKSDAAVISSAPDMLIALKWMLEEFDDPQVPDDMKPGAGWTGNSINAIRLARAVIAKVEVQ